MSVGTEAAGERAATVKAQLRSRAAQVEQYLARCLDDIDIPQRLTEAMRYSLLAGGKRLRPVLCLSTAGLFGLPVAAVLPFACSLELIHTYSLVHDDLPAMDDDDLRRGRPSNHVVYGEALAILAGDGLLTEAFGLMARAGVTLPAGAVLAALSELAGAAGASGMVGGQALDMEYTGRNDIGLTDLQEMHARKTGALIRAACVCGALLAEAPDEDVARMRRYGVEIGAAFQIVDDVLDEVGDEQTLGKPVGSDRDQGKVTYPSLLGVDRSRALAAECVERAVEQLTPYRGETADFLRSLARYIVDRVT